MPIPAEILALPPYGIRILEDEEFRKYMRASRIQRGIYFYPDDHQGRAGRSQKEAQAGAPKPAFTRAPII